MITCSKNNIPSELQFWDCKMLFSTGNCAGQLSVGPAFTRPGPVVSLSALFTVKWPKKAHTLPFLSPSALFEMIFALHRSTFRLTQRQRTLHTFASPESLAILNINAGIISVAPKEQSSACLQSSVSYVFFPMAERLSKSIVRGAVRQLCVKGVFKREWRY